MPNWKKVAVSGSAASFSSLSIATSITASIVSSSQFTGSLFGTASYASYASNGGVTQLLAGANITLAPTNGLGQVTISSTSGGGGFNTATGSYGSFYDTTTQTNPVANIPRSMSFNTTDITNGVSISGSTNPYNTYVKTENAGVYNIQFSAQLDKADSGADEVVIWLAKNGTNLTDSATTITLNGNNDKQVAAWNWFVNSAANDYYQIIWRSADTDLRILAEPADTHPGIPSIILTVNRIDQFLSNTGSFSGSFIGNFTGSLFGTASQAISSSYALSASNAQTASYVLNAVSASRATSAANADTASYVLTAQTASYVLNAVSSSYALTASYAMNGGGSTAVTGANATLNQSVAATTWSFNHNLNNQYPVFQVFDSNNNVVIPQNIEATNTTTATIYFPTAIAGTAVASIGGYTGSLSSSFATTAATASYATNFIVSGSITATQGNYYNSTAGGSIGSVKNLTVSNFAGNVGDWAGLNFAYYNNTTNFGYIGTVVTNANSNAAADMVFGVKASNAASAVTEYVRIKAGGQTTFSSPSSIIANNQGIKVYSTDSQAADLGGGISFGGNYVGTTTTADFANIKSGKDNSTSGNYDGYLAFGTNAQATGVVERMRITSAGNVGIGTTSPNEKLYVNGAIVTNSFLNNNQTSAGAFDFYAGVTRIFSYGSGGTNGIIGFYNGTDSGSASERMRIGAQGNVGIATVNDPDIRLYLKGQNSSSSQLAVLFQNSNSNNLFYVRNDGFSVFNANKSGEVLQVNNIRNNGSSDFALVTTLGSNDNNTSNYHYIGSTGGADRVYIYGNGNIVNANGSYGTLSDISLKENIVDATPKLDDLLKLKVRNFNFIDNDDKQIGFIAQEFEEVFPSMINVDGKSGMKAIKTSVLIPMLVKSIQELEARIKTLENK